MAEKIEFEANNIREEIEKEVMGHPVVQQLIQEYQGKIREIKILKKPE